MIRSLLLALILPTQLCCFGKVVADDLEESLSYFEAALANSEACLSGDVLVWTCATCDATRELGDGKIAGVFYEKNSYERTAFDHVNGLSVTYQYHIEKTVDFDADGKSSERKSWSAFMEDKNDDKYSVVFAQNGSKGRGHGKLTDSKSKPYLRFGHDYRALWKTGKSSLTSLAMAKQMIAAVSNHDPKAYAVKRRPSRISVVFKSFAQGPPGVNFPATTSTVFDSKSLMPVSVKSKFTIGNEDRVVFDWSLKWKEFGGVFTPSSFYQEKKLAIPMSSKNVTGNVVAESKFHWFAVNEDFETAIFDISSVNGVEDILIFTDPKRTNAKSLIAEDKETPNSSTAPLEDQGSTMPRKATKER